MRQGVCQREDGEAILHDSSNSASSVVFSKAKGGNERERVEHWQAQQSADRRFHLPGVVWIPVFRWRFPNVSKHVVILKFSADMVPDGLRG